MRYRLLGPLQVVQGDTPLDIGPPKQRAVLAALLLAQGRVVSVDRLVDAVWGDDVPASAAVEAARWDEALAEADASVALVRGNLLEHLADADWVREDAARTAEMLAECVANKVIRCWRSGGCRWRCGRSPGCVSSTRSPTAGAGCDAGAVPGRTRRRGAGDLREAHAAAGRRARCRARTGAA